MGQAKQQQIKDMERGVDSTRTGYIVCQNCFDSPGLRKFIAENSLENDDPDDPIECDFCDPADASRVVADMDPVCEYMVRCIRHRFSDPAEELPYESAEGGYQGECLNTYDILIGKAELELPNDHDEKLFQALNLAISDEIWCQRNYFSLSPDAAMQFSWEEFQEVSREGSVLDFMYGRIRRDRESRSPVEFLDWLGEQSLEFGLVKTISSTERFFRVRWQGPGSSYKTSGELGPPPAHLAKANRLSPEGTVMMYVAEALDTALKETATGPGTFAVGEFRLLRDIKVLDLVDLPEPICFFDLTDADARDVIGFLRSFAHDVSRPVEGGQRAEIEYVPTQIVTQHFRRRIAPQIGGLDGIRYRSAKDPSGICIGLFADQSSVREVDDGSAKSARRGRVFVSMIERWIELFDSYTVEYG